jgi:hypothetical protein
MTSDDALGVAVHRAKGYVASSQKAYRERGRARKPTVWVWRLTDEGVIEALTKGPLVFTGCNQRWVSLLCFNTTGELLCSVGADDDNGAPRGQAWPGRRQRAPDGWLYSGGVSRHAGHR